MVIPLDLLISYTGNMYEITAAMIKRADQINLTGDLDVEESDGKVVSLSIEQVLSGKVKYQLDDK